MKLTKAIEDNPTVKRMPPKKLQPSNLLVVLPPDGLTGDDVVGEGTDDDACVVVDVDDKLVLQKEKKNNFILRSFILGGMTF